MLFHKIKIQNLLSFGPDGMELELKPLNVLIGANGSGKSNLIDVISILRSLPNSIERVIRSGGGIDNWLWRGGERQGQSGALEVEVANTYGRVKIPIRYKLAFGASNHRLKITDERIETAQPFPSKDKPYLYFGYENGHPILNLKDDDHRELKWEDIDPGQSILSQRKDADLYPELTYLGQILDKIRIYRDWTFGRNSAPRLAQLPDLPSGWLMEDSLNLGLVINRLKMDLNVKKRLVKAVCDIYEGVQDFSLDVQGGTYQIYFEEESFTIPASRLSDGTLRMLSLLAILLDPDPAPLICIEEPELGLHPDLIVKVADLIKEASKRTQIIMTTHSSMFVDCMADQPDAVVVCEKEKGQSRFERLDPVEMKKWLEDDYGLGYLWQSGQIGGTRW